MKTTKRAKNTRRSIAMKQAWAKRRAAGKSLYSKKEWATIRRMVASNKLDAMIQSAPMCDRAGVDGTAWAEKAVAFADALLEELDK